VLTATSRIRQHLLSRSALTRDTPPELFQAVVLDEIDLRLSAHDQVVLGIPRAAEQHLRAFQAALADAIRA
jgi:hypothetical protein